jgi:RNA polymerase sigma-70 factor (ECF subfamily)
MPDRKEALGELALQKALLARAPELRAYLTRKIPVNLQGVIAEDDVLQELWIAAFRGLPNFRPDGPGALDRWLTTLAQRILIDHVKARQAAKRGGPHAILQASIDNLSSVLLRFASSRRPPSGEAALAEAIHAVKNAMDSLPGAWRQVISLRYIEGKSVDEIAKALKKTRYAVDGLLFRARRELRERLGKAADYLSNVPSSDGSLSAT